MSADEKKEIILRAARKVLAEKGYARATIKEIAREAGVARGLLHYHFSNKEDMFIKALESIYSNSIGQEMLDQFQPDNARELVRPAVQMLRYMLENSPEKFQIVYEAISLSRQSETMREALGAVWSGYRRIGEEMVDRLKERGVIKSSLPAKTLITMFITIIHGFGLQYVGENELSNDNSPDNWEALEKMIIYLVEQS
jgi:TetR/AcrR family transcriptional regulator, fatty acid metabolism regulator protein